jgi:hypothetical protein
MDYTPGRHVLRQRLYDFSRSILIGSANTPPTIDRIQALALHSLYHEVRRSCFYGLTFPPSMRTQNEGNFEESYNFSSAHKRLLRTETRCNSIIDTGAVIRMAQACKIF